MSFNSLNLIPPLLQALQTEGYSIPTPIQQQAIPVVLSGRDLIGCAQTGTGKTAAFALPILQLLTQRSAHSPEGRKIIRSLIVTPTRELAIQIQESFKAYGKMLPLKNAVVFGGVSQLAQTRALQAGVDILIATPGRLLDLIGQRFINLSHVEILVLDEADRMLDMGFIHDVKKIIALLPIKRQTLLFSATMPPPIVRLTHSILINPAKVEVTPSATTVEAIKQQVYYVDKPNKVDLLVHLLKNEQITTALVFTRTKYGADKVARILHRANIKVEAIHGNKSQNVRQRVLTAFKTGKLRVLVATDIAARGIDIDDLTHVINFDIPNVPETYVHRIGRTGRAGESGVAISLCDWDEIELLKDIKKITHAPIETVEVHPFPMNEGRLLATKDTPRQQAPVRTVRNAYWGGRSRRSGGPRRAP